VKVEKLLQYIINTFDGVATKNAYGETTFFYNPGSKLPSGSYFCTIKEQDGPNDKSSNLNREGFYRLSFKPSPSTYKKFFGDKPKRPIKGKHIESDFNLSDENVWMPHAVYAWMGWTMVINPSSQKIKEIWPYIEEAYAQAKKNFEKKTDKT
jgi:hypothetical protein